MSSVVKRCLFVSHGTLLRCLTCHRIAIPTEVDESDHLIGECLDVRAHRIVAQCTTDAISRQEEIARYLRSETRWRGS